MDNADISEKFIREELERKLDSMKLTAKDSADNCAECGEQIPSERQIAIQGCQYCHSCQEIIERKALLTTGDN